MTRFNTAVGDGKYSLSFETDNHEHYEYMQREARYCVDGHFSCANLDYQRLQNDLTDTKVELEQTEDSRRRLEADCEHFAALNDALIEDNEALKKKLEQAETLWKATAKTLQDEIDRLTAELAEERKRQVEKPWHDTIHSLQGENIQLHLENERYRDENKNLKKALDSARHSMGVCEESYTSLIQKLQSENDRLTVELRDEQDRFDKLTSYEQARNKMLQEAKHKAKRAELAYNTVMRILERDGYDTLSLFIETGFVVAAEEMKENHDRS